MAVENPQKPGPPKPGSPGPAGQHGRADAAKDHAKPATGKPDDTGRKPQTAGNKGDSAKKGR